MMSSLKLYEVSQSPLTQFKRLLIIENDLTSLELLTHYCQAEGYEVTSEPDSTGALAVFDKLQPHLVLVNFSMPGLSGLEVCQHLRAKSNVAIIMLSEQTDEHSKILALETGADDYLTKPFSPRELMMRVRVILRRLANQPITLPPVDKPSPSNYLKAGKLVINRDTREINYGNITISNLTVKEFEVIMALAQKPGRIYPSFELEEYLYRKTGFAPSRAVSVYISNLRAKLPERNLIETIHGVGYKLNRSLLS